MIKETFGPLALDIVPPLLRKQKAMGNAGVRLELYDSCDMIHLNDQGVRDLQNFILKRFSDVGLGR